MRYYGYEHDQPNLVLHSGSSEMEVKAEHVRLLDVGRLCASSAAPPSSAWGRRQLLQHGNKFGLTVVAVDGGGFNLRKPRGNIRRSWRSQLGQFLQASRW